MTKLAICKGTSVRYGPRYVCYLRYECHCFTWEWVFKVERMSMRDPGLHASPISRCPALRTLQGVVLTTKVSRFPSAWISWKVMKVTKELR
jgi:hypothetical protein